MNNKRNSPLIVHQTVSVATANSLRERILNGDFDEGQSLLQDALAAEYGVSRIPLREALRQLESEGLVTSIPHRGYMVAVLSLEEMLELCQIRALLEGDVLAAAIPNLTDDHFDRAKETLDKTMAILQEDSNDSVYDHSALNWEFHAILYEASKRQRTLQLISSLHNSPDRLARAKAASAIGLETVCREHYQILEYCRQRDVEKAVSFLKNHILKAGDELRKIDEAAQAEDSEE